MYETQKHKIAAHAGAQKMPPIVAIDKTLYTE